MVVGGGRVAARKVEKLLPFGPVLTVIAPRIEDCMRTLEKRPREQEHGAASLLFCGAVFFVWRIWPERIL